MDITNSVSYVFAGTAGRITRCGWTLRAPYEPEQIMNRQIVLVGLATLALAASAAAADAQGFEYYWSGGDGGYNSYGSGPLTYANRYSSGRVASRRRISGFYLCSSPSYSGNYRYDCYGRVYPSLNGFGWPGRRPPMY
jgi:hypothetical protein